MLKVAEAGVMVMKLCRERWMSSAIYDAWADLGSLKVSDSRRLRAIEDDNARLKRLLADNMFGKACLKDLLLD